MVVSDSGLERHRLGKALRRAGLDPAAAVDPWAAEAELGRRDWDVVLWAAAAAERLARDLLGRMSPAPPMLLLPAPVATADVVAAGLAAGFADVASPGAGAGELVARARAVAARTAAARSVAGEAAAFRQLAEGGRDLLARQAPDGTIRYASAAAREILAWDPDALVGRRAPEILPLAALESAPRPYVHRVRRRDGGWAWMETTARPLHDAAGRLHEIHTDSRDVSERVRAEAERAGPRADHRGGGGGRGLRARRRARGARGGGPGGRPSREPWCGSTATRGWCSGPRARRCGRATACPWPSPVTAGSMAPVSAEGRPWGVVLARGLDPGAEPRPARERLGRLAPLVGLAVANSRGRERLVALATTDPLTGLVNHGAFHRRLDEECARAGRSGAPLCLVLIDLDHFKRVNDTHGHQVGDEVLREVARRLAACARRGDVAARIGGEELAWLLPDTALGEGLDAAERLRAAHRRRGLPGGRPPDRLARRRRARRGAARGPRPLGRSGALPGQGVRARRVRGLDRARAGHGSSVRVRRRVAPQSARAVAAASTSTAATPETSGAFTFTTPSTASARP